MKKQVKKLVLAKETLCSLQLFEVRGATGSIHMCTSDLPCTSEFPIICQDEANSKYGDC